jgi:environmental stress-induced protein Ves
MTAPAPRVVALADVAAQPWRNGAGRTRELLAWPDAAAWRVRVSVAEIDCAAPFSSFPGVERWFAVIDGAGVELGIDGMSLRVVPGAPPLRFAGEAAVEGHPIGGPTRDLNFMLRGVRGAMRKVEDGTVWRPDAAACGLFTAAAGRWSTRGDADTAESGGDLPALTLLWFDRAPSTVRFTATPRGKRAGGAPVGWWLAATPAQVGTP